MYSMGIEGDETLPLQQQYASLGGKMDRSNPSFLYGSQPLSSFSREYKLGSQPHEGASSKDAMSLHSSSFDLGRQLTTQLTRALNEGGDGLGGMMRARESPDIGESPRGEEHSPLVYFLSARLLRCGTILQMSCLSLMCLFFIGFGGRGLFVFDEFAGPESVRMSNAFHLLTCILMVGYLIGTIHLALFQIFIADSSKWTRGFRAGSKTLSCAVTLDIIAGALRLSQYLHAYLFSSVQWWARYQRTQSAWSLYHVASTLHAFSLVMYGVAFFLLEAYHDQGTLEENAWAMLGLFSTAGIAELIMVYTNFGGFFTLLLVAALIVSVRWALHFEPLLEAWSPDLHSRNLNENMLPFSNNPEEQYQPKKRDLYRASQSEGGSNGSTVPPVGPARYVTIELPPSGEEDDLMSEEKKSVLSEGGLRSSPSAAGIYMKRNDGGSAGGGSTRILGRYSIPRQEGNGDTDVPKGMPLSVYKTTMPGVNEVPTTYDYRCLNQQISSMTGQGDIEPGMVIR